MSRARPVQDLGVGERGHTRDGDPARRHAAVARPGTTAAMRPPALVERRRRDHGRLQLTVPLDGEERPEQRDPADVVVRPVDRVDVPAHRRIACFGAVLLAHEPMVGKGVGQALADARLDRGVGLGHERPVGLGRDLQVAPEVAPGDLVGLVAGRDGDLEPAPKLVVSAAPERGGPVGAIGGLAGRDGSSVMRGSSRWPGRTAARGRPRSRPTRRTARSRRACRLPGPVAGRHTRSTARR